MADATVRHGRSIRSILGAILHRRRQADPDDLVYLSRSEVRTLIETTAQRELGMTSTEFYAATQRGELQDDPAAAHLALISGARPR